LIKRRIDAAAATATLLPRRAAVSFSINLFLESGTRSVLVEMLLLMQLFSPTAPVASLRKYYKNQLNLSGKKPIQTKPLSYEDGKSTHKH
jgi:hypothetical protein